MDNQKTLNLKYFLVKKDLSEITNDEKELIKDELNSLFEKYNLIKDGGAYLISNDDRPNSDFMEGACKLGVKDGVLYLLGQDNKPIKRQFEIKVTDVVNEYPTAQVSVFVNLNDIIKL